MKLKFAELHSPLFMSATGGKGINMGSKLNSTGGLGHKVGISLFYDRLNKELHVWYQGEVAIIPSTNVASMTPIDPSDVSTAPELAIPVPQPVASPVLATQPIPTKKVSAQVSSPQDHVFQGPGAGKNGSTK